MTNPVTVENVTVESAINARMSVFDRMAKELDKPQKIGKFVVENLVEELQTMCETIMVCSYSTSKSCKTNLCSELNQHKKLLHPPGPDHTRQELRVLLPTSWKMLNSTIDSALSWKINKVFAFVSGRCWSGN
ncbi:unnamed protein product [Amoebophrya sp. A120]|nr:unnamed protein product [Amoebophrya sp. A120]|eukprot:GSA120T00013601001.1